MYIHVLGEVSSLVYTQANNMYVFSPQESYLLAREQKDTVDLVVRYLYNLNQEDGVHLVSLLNGFSP